MNSKTSQYKFPLPGVSTSKASAKVCKVCAKQGSSVRGVRRGAALIPLWGSELPHTQRLRHHLARHALEAETFAERLLELHLGLELEGPPLDHRRGREVLGSHALGIIALTAHAHDEGSEVVEHHATASEQRLGDEGFDTCQHGHDVTLGTGGGESDILGEVIEIIVTVLDSYSVEIIHFGVLGVAALDHFVSN